MSKSLGNVVDPTDLLGMYGACAVRYFLMQRGILDRDNDFDAAELRLLANKHLANNLGNLLSRATSERILGAAPQLLPALPEGDILVPLERDLLKSLEALPGAVQREYDELRFDRGLSRILDLVARVNVYFSQAKPWELVRGSVGGIGDQRPPACGSARSSGLSSILHISLECLRVSGLLLQPVVPVLSEKLLNDL